MNALATSNGIRFAALAILAVSPGIARAQFSCPGDLNGDGIVNQEDSAAFAAALLYNENTGLVDLTGDGQANGNDVQVFAELVSDGPGFFCAPGLGACCYADGTCLDNVEPEVCTGPLSVFQPGLLCGINACEPRGACCSSGDCFILNGGATGCTETLPGATFLGIGVPCEPGLCPDKGACCLSLSDCIPSLTEPACEAQGGAYMGFGSACEPNLCSEPIPGACCAGSECTETTHDTCFLGRFLAGAACLPNNPCTPVTEAFWLFDEDGNWNDGSNWSTGAPPQPGRVAVIDKPSSVVVTHSTGTSMPDAIQSTATIRVTGGTLQPTLGTSDLNELIVDGGEVRVDDTLNVAHLTLNSDTLRGAGAINVIGRFDFVGGTITDPGTLTNQAGAVTSISGPASKTISGGRTFLNNGFVEQITFQAVGLLLGALLHNHGLYIHRSDAPYVNSSGIMSQIRNSGLFVKTDAAGSTVVGNNILFENDGVVTIGSGQLAYQGGGSGSGTWKLAPGTRVEFVNGVYELIDNAKIVGPGTAKLAGGTLRVSGSPIEVDNFDMAGGVLDGSGELQINQSMDWSLGAQSGPGATTVAPGAQLVLSGSGDKTMQLGRTLTLGGAAAATGEGDLYLNGGSSLNILPGAAFDVQSGMDFEFFSGASSAVNNMGTIMKSGGSDPTRFDMGLALNNSGSVTVLTGTLFIEGTGVNAGTFTAVPDTTVQFHGNPSYTLDAGTALQGQGVYRVGAGALVITGEVDGQRERLDVVNGTLENNGTLQVGEFTQSGGVVSGSGQISVTQQGTWNGGAHSRNGTTTIPPGAVLTLTGPATKTIQINRIVNNGGTVVLEGGG